MNKSILGLCTSALMCTGLTAQSYDAATNQQQKDSIPLQSLDEVVVSDSRFKLKRENSGKTVIKISAEELKRNQGKTIPEIINTKSGFEIAGSRGRDGVNLGVFARGGRGRQVLIIIDGVRVADPSSFSSEYDLRLLSPANVESIEIIKGASSTLYGANAATAVITITTKKASNRKIALNVSSTAETNQTAKNQNYNLLRSTNSARVSGTLNKFSYAIASANTYAEGLSALVTPGDEKDPFSKFSTDLTLGYAFSKAFELKLYGNQTKVRNDFDESFGLSDAPYELNSKQERVGMAAEWMYTNGTLHVNAAYSDYDAESRSSSTNIFAARNTVIDIFNKYKFNERLYTVIGLNYINDKADLLEDEEFTITDPYANVVYVSEFGLNVNAGARYNDHSEYGGNVVYNLNPSFTLKSTDAYFKLLTSYATSYITPNLTQLFGAFGANPDLEPEEDRTIEGGIEYAKNDKIRLSALYFNRKEEKFITFDPVTFGSINAENTIDAQGVEVELDWKLIPDVSVNVNYTFTERKGDNAIRLPKHKVNASLGYQISKRTNASMAYALTGTRFDSDFSSFPAVDVALDSYSLVDLYFGHELIPNKLRVFLNVTNLLNESFTEVLGFTTRGRNIRIGFNLDL